MRRSFALTTILTYLLLALSHTASVAQAAGLPDYVLGSDTFTITSSRPVGSQLDGQGVEHFSHGNETPLWDASENLVLGADGTDGYVQTNDGGSGLGYLDAIRHEDYYPFHGDWFVQADVKFNSDGDKVHLGMLGDEDGLTAAQKTFEGGYGQVWVEYGRDGDWRVMSAGGNVIGQSGVGGAPGPIAPGGLVNPVQINWNVDSNLLSARINGVTVVDAYSMLGHGNHLDTYGFGFELGGTSQLDNFAALPEPSTIVLGSLGAVGMLFYGYRNRRRQPKSE